MGKTFEFYGNEEEKYDDFCERHKHPEINEGTIGGHISVTFNITSIGDMPSVKCDICGEEENITDFNTL